MLKYLVTLAYIAVFVNSVFGQKMPHFDAENAFAYLKTQCDFGPRYPGSAGHRECLKYLIDEFEKYTGHVRQQNFSYPMLNDQQPVTMTNIIASFYPDLTARIMLCAHWDTRPWADRDPNPENRSKPVPGAHDGASGVAVLLELSRILSENVPPVGVDIILFDGEDFGSYGNENSWAIGSREFAGKQAHLFEPLYAVLLDMIGDRDQQIYMEQISFRYAPQITNKIWQTAASLGITEFIPEPRYEIMDDHVRLLNAGIPCVNIIDFDYKYWHTVEDTPDKCSAASLENVGTVLLPLIYENEDLR
ncbi:M28 family peptidase [candidate division KSB1 bacterium]|nr:M28 family peptidase [candidate division KSB1 bacterium]